MILLCFVLSTFHLVVSSGDTCGGHVMARNGQTGQMHSPGYPNQYAHQADCTYTIGTTAQSSHIKISFSVFGIEEHALCSFDYVEIYDGPTTDSTKVGRWCGNNKPPAFSSSGRYVTIKFVSDESVNELGFVFDYSVGCASHVTETSGTITSPSYPGNYPDDTNCDYTIEPSSGSQFLISFLHFSVEDSTDCAYDYLQLTNGKKGDVDHKLCGDKTQFKMLVNGTQLQLKFVSDESVSRSGFQFKYEMTDSCSNNNGGCEVSCQDIAKGKVLCSCLPGYELDADDGVSCNDINECDDNPCSEQCTNTPGSYQCSCTTDGYILSPDSHTCTDMTCKQSNGGCEHICQPSGPAQYHCACHSGYRLNDDNHNCTDIDECTTSDTDYQNQCQQRCINQPGSYYCECGTGWKLSTNGRSCEDLQECIQHEDKCSHSCVDTPGSWKCTCDIGYKLDPDYYGECIDIDECAEHLAPKVCTTCHNYEGGFECECPQGYTAYENGTDCQDINECAVSNGGCHQLCLNKPGSFSCACQKGFNMATDGSSRCLDINECATNNGNGPCDHYCENLEGSFECYCLDGYQLLGDELSCKDVNECEDKDKCDQDCVNTAGSYYCKCFDGYESVGGAACSDIDECQDVTACTSHKLSNCTNTPGGYACSCPPGYDVIDNKCVDIDECALGHHDCVQVCDNTPGSYVCNCGQGFTKTGDNVCSDINECSNSPCDQTCFNSIGSFDCDCHEGYYLLADGKSCSDINECKEETDNCEQKCVNHIGKHSCACWDGFQLNHDNYSCSDINECAMNSSGCSDADHCLNMPGSFFCFCDSGYMLDVDNKTCIDKNECAVDNGGCQHICTNTPGSFKCGCDPGYVFDGSTNCDDLDECAINKGNCSQHCNNFDGGYNCSCEGNYKLGEDKLTCSLCPTCEDFTKVRADVDKLINLQDTLTQVLSTLRRIGAAASNMEQRISRLEILANDEN